MDVKIKRIGNGKLPEYKTEGSAGADCYARIDYPIALAPGKVTTIPLGFAVELPEGYEMQIRGRSGLARKNNVEVFNSPGTIDSDYRGEVSAILFNNSDEKFIINPGDRIAQAIIAPVIKANWNEVEELSETERGSGGFGSTGVSEKKIEKFYEPFKNAEKAAAYIGKDVLLYGEPATVQKVELAKRIGSSTAIIIYFFNKETLKTVNLYASQAFQLAEIDGHRFGQEMECNEKTN